MRRDADTASPTSLAKITLRRVTFVAPGARAGQALVQVCFGCLRVREGAAWRTLAGGEEASPLTHGLCPGCLDRLYPEPAGAERAAR